MSQVDIFQRVIGPPLCDIIGVDFQKFRFQFPFIIIFSEKERVSVKILSNRKAKLDGGVIALHIN